MATVQIKIDCKGTMAVSSPRIPFDVITEILRRLPAKSLMRFKCVCKDWLDLIRDPRFAESHLSHSRTRPEASCVLFLKNESVIFATDQELVPIYSQIPENRFRPHEPCSNIVNGLICLHDSSCNHTVVFNLTTGEKRDLPTTTLTGRFNSYALGFDPISNKYKVLHFASNLFFGEDVVAGCEILTFGSKPSWIKLAEPTFWVRPTTLGPIYLDGVIFFVEICIIDFNNLFIGFFDLTSGKCGTITPPKNYDARHLRRNPPYLAEVGGNLCFVAGEHTSNGTWDELNLKIWALDRNRCNWSEKAIISLIGDDVDFVQHPKISGRIGTGEILLHQAWRSRLFLYDMKTSTYKSVRGPYDRCCSHFDYYPVPISCNHVENILPLSSIE